MNKRVLVLLLLVVLAPGLSAKTVDIESGKMQIDLPDDWTMTPGTAPVVFIATNPDNSFAATLIGTPNDQNLRADNSSFIDGVKKGMRGKMEPQGITLKVDSEGPLVLKGVPAYCFKGSLEANGKTAAYLQNYSVAGNGKMYLLSIQTQKPDSDAAMAAIANTFAFKEPPTLPTGGSDNDNLAYHLGQVIGFAMPLLVLAVLIKWLRRKKASTP